MANNGLKIMARYKLSNAMSSTIVEEHENDEAAWNSLRKIYRSSRFTWLWKEIEITVPINNEEHYVEEWNSTYGPKPIGYGPEDAKLMKVGEKNIETLWIPVLAGITTDEYKVNNNADLVMHVVLNTEDMSNPKYEEEK